MGNKPSVSVNEAIYIAAKNGKAGELEALLRNARPETRPGSLLEWQDDAGRTPLIIATVKDHVQCVELLLRYRANVQHMSRKQEGGTALHEAVVRQVNRRIVEALLKYGASPFVENLSRFTAMDYAIVKRDAGLLRRLEKCGYFTQYVNVRCRRNLGLSKAWLQKWVAIFPRYGCPHRPRQPIHRLMLIYSDARSFDPISKIYLDGSNARQVTGNHGQPQALLVLHRSHVQPKGVAAEKDVSGHWLINFRADRQGLADVTSLINAMNAQHEIPLQATEGESDEAFARRIQAEGSAEHPPTPGNQQAPPLATRASDPLPSFNAPPPSNEQGYVPAQEDEDTDDDVAPSAPPLPPEYVAVADQGGPSASSATYDKLGMDSTELAEDEGLCVICLDKPKSAGFVHGSSIHRCCCQECAVAIKKNGNGLCPICRQEIQHVITDFFL